MSDVIIVGGGIIGLLTARELTQAGANVTLLEMGEIGKESSWAGGGILSPLYPWRYEDAVTALARWSQRIYPSLCAQLFAETNVDPEFEPSGLLILDPEEQEEATAWAAQQHLTTERIGLDRRETLAPGLAPNLDHTLWFPDIGQIRNPRLIRAVRLSIESSVVLRTHEPVLELRQEGGKILGLRTAKSRLDADQVIVCTGAWTAPLLGALGQTPETRPVRGQMLLFDGNPGLLGPVCLLRDHYLIPRRDGHILAGSTLEETGFEKETTAEAKEALYGFAVELFPPLRRLPIEHHWAGLRPGSPKGIPYIGPYPGIEGLYVNAGHFRNGLVTAPASARLMADLVLGREPIIEPAPYALERTAGH